MFHLSEKSILTSSVSSQEYSNIHLLLVNKNILTFHLTISREKYSNISLPIARDEYFNISFTFLSSQERIILSKPLDQISCWHFSVNFKHLKEVSMPKHKVQMLNSNNLKVVMRFRI